MTQIQQASTAVQWSAEERRVSEIGWRAARAELVERAVSRDAVAWAHVMEARVDVQPVPWAEVARWTSSSEANGR